MASSDDKDLRGAAPGTGSRACLNRLHERWKFTGFTLLGVASLGLGFFNYYRGDRLQRENRNFQIAIVALTEELQLEPFTLKQLASTQVRFLIGEALSDERSKRFLAEERYDILRTKATYQRCMDVAFERNEWKKMSL